MSVIIRVSTEELDDLVLDMALHPLAIEFGLNEDLASLPDHSLYLIWRHLSSKHGPDWKENTEYSAQISAILSLLTELIELGKHLPQVAS